MPEGGIDLSPFDQPRSRSNSKSSGGGRLSWTVQNWHFMEGLESKAVLIIVRIAFVLVFLGERENSDMTVSGSPPKYANSCKGFSQNGGPQNLTLDFPMKSAIYWECLLGMKTIQMIYLDTVYRSRPSFQSVHAKAQILQ